MNKSRSRKCMFSFLKQLFPAGKNKVFFCFYGVLVWVSKCFQNHHLPCVCNFNFCVLRKGLTWVNENSPLFILLHATLGNWLLWLLQHHLIELIIIIIFFLTLAAWLNGSQCLSGSQTVSPRLWSEISPLLLDYYPSRKSNISWVTSLTSLTWVWVRVRLLVGQLPGLITNYQFVVPFKLLLQFQAKY